MGLALCACFSREVPPAAAADDHREPERTSRDAAATDEHQPPSERSSHVADAERSSPRSSVVRNVRASAPWRARIFCGVIPRSWRGLERLGHSNGINCTLDPNRHWLQRHVLRGWIKHVAQQRVHRFYALLDQLFDHRAPMRARTVIAEMALESWPRVTPFIFRQYMYRD